jgi:FAD/FMN-containing dehydrogenase
MADVATLRQDLEAIVGARNLVPVEDQAQYEHGYRYGPGKAAAIVRPDAVENIRRLVSYCVEHHLRLIPQGAHTGLVGAATPDDSGTHIVLSLERLRAIHIDPLNRTATCGAGVRLSALNAAAAEHGLHLPIDLGADPTIGGMVATNTGGSKLLRYGGMREQVTGVEAVLADADATLIRDVKGLRKNNVGVDLKHLFIGSGGALGIVTEVQVQLQPVLTVTTTALLIPAAIASIPLIVSKLEAGLDRFLIACEGMSRGAMCAALDSHPALRRPFDTVPDYALLIEVGGSVATSHVDFASMLEGVLMACFEVEPPLVLDALIGRGNDFWALRHAISDGLKASGRVIGFDISVRRDKLPQTRMRLIEVVSALQPDLEVCDFGHVADGALHFNIVVPVGLNITAHQKATLRRGVFDVTVNEFDGSFSAEHGIGPANAEQYARYRPASERSLIDRIKNLVDPAHILGR